VLCIRDEDRDASQSEAGMAASWEGGGSSEGSGESDGGTAAASQPPELDDWMGLDPYPLPEELTDTEVTSGGEGASHRGVLAKDVQGFVISISKRWKLRRLHRLHGCSRAPGVHYHDFEGPFADVPDQTDYDAYCKDCWTGKKGPADVQEEKEAESSSTGADEDR